MLLEHLLVNVSDVLENIVHLDRLETRDVLHSMLIVELISLQIFQKIVKTFHFEIFLQLDLVDRNLILRLVADWTLLRAKGLDYRWRHSIFLKLVILDLHSYKVASVLVHAAGVDADTRVNLTQDTPTPLNAHKQTFLAGFK